MISLSLPILANALAARQITLVLTSVIRCAKTGHSTAIRSPHSVTIVELLLWDRRGIQQIVNQKPCTANYEL
jgi:hypothetical protein